MVNVQPIQVCALRAICAPLLSLMQRLGFASNEDGQGLSEYVLLVSLLVALIVSAMSLYTSPLATFYDSMINSFDLIFRGATL